MVYESKLLKQYDTAKWILHQIKSLLAQGFRHIGSISGTGDNSQSNLFLWQTIKDVSMLDNSEIQVYVSQIWVITLVDKQQISSVKPLALNLLRNQTPVKKLMPSYKLNSGIGVCIHCWARYYCKRWNNLGICILQNDTHLQCIITVF